MEAEELLLLLFSTVQYNIVGDEESMYCLVH